MQPLFEHRLELGGYETRALELEGEGPPLLLLHGYADSADTWRRMLALLGRHGRRAIALDLPGFATADPLATDEPVVPQLDRFVDAAVLHAAGAAGTGGAPAEDVVIAGNSLGGLAALRAAQREELPIAGIVPIAPAGLDMPGWFRVIELNPLVQLVLRSPIPPPPIVTRALIGEAYRQLAFARPWRTSREVIGSFTHHHNDRAAVARYIATGRRLLPEIRSPFEFGKIACPVLLIWGDRDRMVTHKGSRLILDALPDTDYQLIEGCGHCPQVEEPERVTELLIVFAPAARKAA